MLTRREFLKNISFTGFASTVLPFRSPSGVLPSSGQFSNKENKVVIIGAGLAGLAAADELVNAGYDAAIVEARERAGGRVYTLREPFTDGLYAEAGATRIPDNHHLTFHYIRQFGLRLAPFRPSGLSTVYYIGGKRHVTKRGKAFELPGNLTGEERKLGLAGMRQKYVNTPLKGIEGDLASELVTEAMQPYDQITWPEFLKKQGASDDAVKLLTMGHNAGMLKSVSALLWLHYTALRLKRSGMFKIYGGNDLLPRAFAEKLEKRIQYETQVVGITRTTAGLHVDCVRRGERRSYFADRVIAAVPFSVLKDIRVTPPFSSEKQRAIQELEYVSCARVFLQMKRKFWLDDSLDGFGVTDIPISEIWDMTSSQQGPGGILLGYMTGEHAREICSLDKDARIRTVVDQAEKIYPGTRNHFERGHSVCWDEDPWARGAWALFKPGQMTSLLEQISKPDGRIHFAGDHTSTLPGWMQGALSSGLRAAREILEAKNNEGR